MKKIRPVFKAHGGKFYLAEFIISHFPKNYMQMRYIEGCGGAASVLLNKQRSISEIYNDADPQVANIIQELAVEDSLEFVESIRQVKYTEEVFKWAKATSEIDCCDHALAELVRRRFSRGGMRQAFAWSERLRGGQPGDVNAWETYKDSLKDIADRLKGIEVYCLPVSELIARFDAPDVLWYIDPPYLPTTRQSKNVYSLEMTEEDHVDLANKLNNAKGKVLLSGYQSTLYSKLYKGWKVFTKVMANHSSQVKKKQKRIEVLWRNY